MPDTYTEATVDRAGVALRHALKTRTIPPHPIAGGGLGLSEYACARAVLEATADAIARQAVTEALGPVRTLADELAPVAGQGLTERELRVVSKYAVPEVMERHTVVYVLDKMHRDLRAALAAAEGGEQ